MIQFFKKILKRILPPTIFILVRELDDVRRLIRSQAQKLNVIDQLSKKLDMMNKFLTEMSKFLTEMSKNLVEVSSNITELDNNITELDNKLKALDSRLLEQGACDEELHNKEIGLLNDQKTFLKDQTIDIVLRVSQVDSRVEKLADGITKQCAKADTQYENLIQQCAKADTQYENLIQQCAKADTQYENLIQQGAKENMQLENLMEQGVKANTQFENITRLVTIVKTTGEKNLNEQRMETTIVREILWANVYNNAVSKSSWLQDNSFAPGRWAVGYPLLYVLYNTLDKSEPRRILELGLGQSTHMITQYAFAHPETEHLVVEESKEFAQFFMKNNDVAPNTQIQYLPYVENAYREDLEVRVYEGFQELVGDRQFDLILIDAPSYNGKSTYSRVDILSVLQKCLNDKFVIILDDCNREPEMNTGDEITRILTEQGVAFCEGKYTGEKIFRIWSSENLRYLCSL